jgi:hypothetical protein
MGSNAAVGDDTSSFCLKWNDFAANLSTAFSDLRRQNDFFDVTLVTKDGSVPAHKVILRSVSGFTVGPFTYLCIFRVLRLGADPQHAERKRAECTIVPTRQIVDVIKSRQVKLSML